MNTSIQVLGTNPPRSGISRPGESWENAAVRISGGRGTPMAHDLRGEVKRFLVEPTCHVGLRPMTRYDLKDLARWLRADHVAKWWHREGPSTDEAVAERYGRVLDGLEATEMWVVEANGRSIGFMSDYRISDHPEYALLTASPEAVGVDYAIGEAAWVGRGWGPLMLWAWARHAHERHPDVATFFAAPDHRNGASLRALAKVGFVAGTWFDEKEPDGTVSTVVGCTFDVRRLLG